MILLLGGNGYIGTEFRKQLDLTSRQYFTAPHSEHTLEEALESLSYDPNPGFVINCAGYTGKPNVDACETQQDECYKLNVDYPKRLRMLCEGYGFPWLHVSSGCIYKGAKLSGQVVDDIRPYYEDAVDCQGMIEGFTEEDEPNFSFKHPPCSFYSGTKALGEIELKDRNGYVCRLRIPFDTENNPRNYLTKLLKYPKYYDNINSLSQRGEFVSACLSLIDQKAPYGIYNVTNPGYVSTETVVSMIQHFRPDISKKFSAYVDDEEFYSEAATTPRSNCILESKKLADVGIKMRPVHEALEQCIADYKLI
jgi:dTDP-4-dehydrorhamnose reductase